MHLVEFFKLTLIFCLFSFASAAEVTFPRICKQCVGGTFLRMQWLMQHERTRQMMAWVDAWKNTNCDTGKIKTIGCFGACLTIQIWKGEEEKMRGYMHDCSDEIIVESPDLPKEENFYHYYKNGTFMSRRLNHSITYTFEMVDYKSQTKMTAALHGEEPKNEWPANLVKNPEAGAVLVIAVMLLVIVCLCCVIRRNKTVKPVSSGESANEFNVGSRVRAPSERFRVDESDHLVITPII